mmetsp:Transcript_68276/g.142265  ORF Transcript_68276/g.142265 Transcript_68276/m.142265 type:complete len:404 (-) Transcript_68276:592-1803(-)
MLRHCRLVVNAILPCFHQGSSNRLEARPLPTVGCQRIMRLLTGDCSLTRTRVRVWIRSRRKHRARRHGFLRGEMLECLIVQMLCWVSVRFPPGFLHRGSVAPVSSVVANGCRPNAGNGWGNVRHPLSVAAEGASCWRTAGSMACAGNLEDVLRILSCREIRRVAEVLRLNEIPRLKEILGLHVKEILRLCEISRLNDSIATCGAGNLQDILHIPRLNEVLLIANSHPCTGYFQDLRIWRRHKQFLFVTMNKVLLIAGYDPGHLKDVLPFLRLNKMLSIVNCNSGDCQNVHILRFIPTISIGYYGDFHASSMKKCLSISTNHTRNVKNTHFFRLQQTIVLSITDARNFHNLFNLLIFKHMLLSTQAWNFHNFFNLLILKHIFFLSITMLQLLLLPVISLVLRIP